MTSHARLLTVVLAGVLMLAGCGSTDAVPTTESPSAVSTPSQATTQPDDTTMPTSPLAIPGSSTTVAPRDPGSIEDLIVTPIVVAEGFDQPVFVTAPEGDSRLFVVDQPGIIWVIDGNDPEVFLDIRDRVVFDGEQGLLGLAFAPDFEGTGLFYVDYVSRGPATHVSEFRSDGLVADADSERVLLTIDQPASNHNGGMIAFGPDRLLWIGMGDGGSRDDRFGNGQDPATLLGTMLRIDPDGDPYVVPDTNPGPPFAPEVWAIGLRNPWRFSFDGTNLWIGDVGQDKREEIDRVDVSATAGVNFGWPRFEGPSCYLSTDCAADDLTAPVFDYPHSEGCSVTGGYVYRGTAIPELQGHYLFGDFCGGWVRSLAPGASGEPYEWLAPGTVPGLSSFGLDGRGEVYVTSTEGVVYRLDGSP